MSGSVKVMLYRHKTNSDGTHPVVIQVIINRKPKKVTIANVFPDQWDEDNKRVKPRKHVNATQINLNISSEFSRIEREILAGNVSEVNINAILNPDRAKLAEVCTMPEKQKRLLVDAIRDQAKRFYNQNRIPQYNNHNALANDIQEYAGPGFNILDATNPWVNSYLLHIKTREKLKNTANTIRKKLQWLRAVFKIEKAAGNISVDPTEGISVKGQKRLKQKLKSEELEYFANTVALTDHQQMCQDIFLLQVYNRGMRIGDVLMLREEYLQGDRLVYSDEKTEKQFDIQLQPEAMAILKKYTTGKPGRIFPLFKWEYDYSLEPQVNEIAKIKELKRATVVVNNALKKLGNRSGIEKKITTHIARHTYSKMAFDIIKNPRITMGLVGHTSLKVHQAYIEDLQETDELDAADQLVFQRQKV